MPGVGDLVANLTMNSRGFSAGLSQARGQLATFGAGAGRLLGGIAGQLGLVAGAGSLVAGLGFGVKLAADAEKAEAAFTVLTGSAQKAQTLISGLREYGKKTGFGFEIAAEQSKQMLAYGIAVENVLPTMKMLGDIALGDSEKFGRLAYALGQVNSYGKLRAQERNQFTESGFNPLQELALMSGKSIGVLEKEMEDGKISVERLFQALEHATSKGGRFFGSTSTLAKTLGGEFSQLRAESLDTLRKIGTGMAETFDLKGIVRNLKTGFADVNSFFDDFSINVELSTARWTIALEEWSAGSGGIFQNLMIVATSAFESMGKSFGTFLQTMRAGVQEAQSWGKAEGAGLREFWNKSDITNAPRRILDWLDTHDLSGTKKPYSADILFGKHRQQDAVDPFTGKKLTAWEAHNRARDKVLAGQADAMKPGTDLISTFQKLMLEKNEALRNKMGGGTLKEMLEKRVTDLQWRLAEWGGGSDAGQAVGMFNRVAGAEAAAAKAKSSNEAALKGSQAAARTMLAGTNDIAKQQLQQQKNIAKGIGEIAKAVGQTGLPQVRLMVADV